MSWWSTTSPTRSWGTSTAGFANENGPVTAYLAAQTPTTPCGTTLFDLIIAMVNGRAYVNVHTRQNTGGEIRGQISAVAPFTIP